MSSIALQPIAPPARVTDLLAERPSVRGKFFYRGPEKIYLRGVTYGTFSPDSVGNDYGTPSMVRRDFEAMTANGINAVRTYTVPPRWLLDVAQENALQVMVGLPWEQHVTFLDSRRQASEICSRMKESVRTLAGHNALFCITVGNEIPAGIVRWHGKPRVEGFIHRLWSSVKEVDPEVLVTYVNYPTTEYLELPFLDFACFNVYLEAPDRFDAYLARLQNLTGNRPLVLAEIGLDSRRNGPTAQAWSLDWQVRGAFARGCAGAFVFSWTDDWYRGGCEIDDWDFGLVSRERMPKPALDAVRAAYAEVPFSPRRNWPRVSVVVCSYNGARTIRQTLEHLSRIEYPNYEVIVVDDGSTDRTAAIASEFDVNVVRTANGGLSSARTIGMSVATGEIISYIDDDAYPDPHYLFYLAHTFMTTGFVAVGGPNIPPDGEGMIAEAVANAPGGPVQVLTSDTVAEHIPGCNFAVRRRALQAINGFDPNFRVAGDDVDACWRLQQNDGVIGFHHGAVVWHHRRNSVGAYWKQQRGYGRAEALLERRWPEKYNDWGHMRWAGQLYGYGILRALNFASHAVYHGSWGQAPFQSIYSPAPSLFASFVQMPEWMLILGFLLITSLAEIVWKPLQFAVPLFAVGALATLVQVILSVRRAEFPSKPSGWRNLKLRMLTGFLYFLQPLARLWGRLEYGLSPWRRSRRERQSWAIAGTETLWSERWCASYEWLDAVCRNLRSAGADYVVGSDFDRWDLRINNGLFGQASLLMAIEEHGQGRQLVRFKLRPYWGGAAPFLIALASAGAMLMPGLAIVVLLIAIWTYRSIATATWYARLAIRNCKDWTASSD